MKCHQENCAYSFSLNLSKKVIMKCHFFLKNFLFKKFFLLIVLAVFSNACSSSSSDSSSSSSGDSSSSSNDQKTDPPSKKPQVSVSSCTIKEFEDETGKTQAIVAGKGQDLEREQTLKFFYDCNIAKKDYNQKATLAVSGNTAITTSVTEIAIPAQAKIADSFTVTGLKTANTNVQTSIKIKLEKSDVLTQLALKVIPTFTLDPSKVKIETVTTLASLDDAASESRKLEVYQDTLYLLNSKGSSHNSYPKFYSSPDGKAWTPLANPQDSTDKMAGNAFDTTVYDGKLWLIGASGKITGNTDNFWNFDGTNWKRIGASDYSMNFLGSLVVFKNTLYQVGGTDGIYAYEGGQWKEKHEFSKITALGRVNSVVFDDKIWIVGGQHNNTDNSTTRLKTVATFDGTTYQKDVATLPNNKNSWWAAVEVFPRGLLAIGGVEGAGTIVSAVFYSRFGTSWKEITTIKAQKKLEGVFAGGTVVWKDALWAVNKDKEVLKITYEE